MWQVHFSTTLRDGRRCSITAVQAGFQLMPGRIKKLFFSTGIAAASHRTQRVESEIRRRSNEIQILDDLLQRLAPEHFKIMLLHIIGSLWLEDHRVGTQLVFAHKCDRPRGYGRVRLFHQIA